MHAYAHTHKGTCYNMGEPSKPYAKRNKPVTEDYILFDSMDTTECLSIHIYVKYPEESNP